MNVMLADSIGPGLLWIVILLAGIGCTGITFAGIFPAALGRIRLAIALAAPAFFFSIVTTVILIYFFRFAPDSTPAETPSDGAQDLKFFWQVWIFFSGIPLALSLFVVLLAFVRNRIRRNGMKPFTLFVALMLLALAFAGCSKQPDETEFAETALNGMPQKETIDLSPAVPFQISSVWPDAETILSDGFRIQVANLIEAKNYDALDNLAAKLRSSKEQYPGGSWKLGDLYAGLIPSRKQPDTEWESRLSKLRDWIKTKPDSITARVALAYVLVDYAWKARGGGWADTVTEEGWQLFGERLRQAVEVLDEAKDLKEKCPVYWSTRMIAGRGLNYDKDQFDEIFNQAVKYTPDYKMFYLRKAQYLMPRWGGDEGELEMFLEKSADKMGGDEGDMLYAQGVWNIHACASSENVFTENGFSWPRVNRGFKIIERRFPDSIQTISEHAYLAAYAGDAAVAREYLKKTSGQAALAIFHYQSEYVRVANWAFEK